MKHHNRPQIPPALRPSLSRLPFLIWTCTMAYTVPPALSGPCWWRVLVRPFFGALMVLLVSYTALIGEVAALPNGRALVCIAPRGVRRPLKARLLRAVMTLGAAIFTAAVLAGIDYAVLAGTTPFWGMVLVLAAVLALVAAPLRPNQMIRAERAISAVARRARAAGQGPVWTLNLLAAWPHKGGHGGALAQQLHQHALAGSGPRGTFLALPRDKTLANWYQQLGMTPDPLNPEILTVHVP